MHSEQASVSLAEAGAKDPSLLLLLVLLSFFAFFFLFFLLFLASFFFLFFLASLAAFWTCHAKGLDIANGYDTVCT
jgi:hypothetical protein